MFTLPPLPPKDYILRDVNQNQKSCQEHSPIALPRITQASLGKFCHPIPYQDKEKLNNVAIEPINPQVLDRWTAADRAFWVNKPGKNDQFLHDIFHKFTVEVEASYDARYRHKEKVFYRSFQYELECLEDARLQKLRDKTHREVAEEEEKRKVVIVKDKAMESTDLGIKTCKETPPFWWKRKTEDFTVPQALAQPEVVEVQKQLRWQAEPDPLAQTEPCQRRYDMALIGQTFRSDACNWYYDNYPPPNLRFIPKKFS